MESVAGRGSDRLRKGTGGVGRRVVVENWEGSRFWAVGKGDESGSGSGASDTGRNDDDVDERGSRICAVSGLSESGIGDDLGNGSETSETVRINVDEKSGICEFEVRDGLGDGSGICETVGIRDEEKSGICEVGDDGGEGSGI